MHVPVRTICGNIWGALVSMRWAPIYSGIIIGRYAQLLVTVLHRIVIDDPSDDFNTHRYDEIEGE